MLPASLDWRSYKKTFLFDTKPSQNSISKTSCKINLLNKNRSFVSLTSGPGLIEPLQLWYSFTGVVTVVIICHILFSNLLALEILIRTYVKFDVVCLDVQLPQSRSDTSPSHGCAIQLFSVAPAKKSGSLYSSSLPLRRFLFMSEHYSFVKQYAGFYLGFHVSGV